MKRSRCFGQLAWAVTRGAQSSDPSTPATTRPGAGAGRPRQLARRAALDPALLQSQADRPAWPNLTRHAHPGAPGPHAAVLNHQGRTGSAAAQAPIDSCTIRRANEGGAGQRAAGTVRAFGTPAYYDAGYFSFSQWRELPSLDVWIRRCLLGKRRPGQLSRDDVSV